MPPLLLPVGKLSTRKCFISLNFVVLIEILYCVNVTRSVLITLLSPPLVAKFCPPLLLSPFFFSPPFPFSPLPSLSSLPSPQHMTEMYGKLHTAFRKVVDIMATGKRYLGTYFRVAFFGKVSQRCTLLSLPSFLPPPHIVTQC